VYVADSHARCHAAQVLLSVTLNRLLQQSVHPHTLDGNRTRILWNTPVLRDLLKIRQFSAGQEAIRMRLHRIKYFLLEGLPISYCGFIVLSTVHPCSVSSLVLLLFTLWVAGGVGVLVIPRFSLFQACGVVLWFFFSFGLQLSSCDNFVWQCQQLYLGLQRPQSVISFQDL